MSTMRLVFLLIVTITGCTASGIGHIAPAIRSFPIVRYAPYYNFPTGVRSIHAVAPALPVATAPALPAAWESPVLPASLPVARAPFLPAPFLPAPLPVASAPAPLLPGPAPLPAPVFPSFLSAPLFTPAVPRLSPAWPPVPQLSPLIHSLPPAPFISRAVHPLPVARFSPIIRPVAAAAHLPAPFLQPAQFHAAQTSPYNVISPHLHLAPTPLVKEIAWK